MLFVFQLMDYCESGSLITCGRENTESFVNEFIDHNRLPEAFLHRESTVRIRDCLIGTVAQDLWLNFELDIDGIVATFRTFSTIRTPFSYTTLLLRKQASLTAMYPILKKHVGLHQYNATAIQYLKWSKGFQMFEGSGFQFHFALLPTMGNVNFVKYNRNGIENTQYEFYEKFRKQVSSVISNLDQNNLSRNTFKKNTIFDIRRLHVLPDDREFVLQVLDTALLNLNPVIGFEPIIIACKFGDRDHSKELPLEAFDTSNAKVSVHIALTISSPILNQNLFWSRFGIQEMVGNRGTLLTALSISSCANYQSNLDGRLIDISAELRKIIYHSEELRFIQFYADTPHLSSTAIHPVFGAIASCGILNGKVQQALETRAKEYISLAFENTLKLNRVGARLEVVCISGFNRSSIQATDFLCIENIKNIIARYPLIVPFNECCSQTNCKFIDTLRSIPQHICYTLNNLFDRYNRKGGFLSVWKAYQYEAANEIFWKGRPNAAVDNTFNINLGPGGSFPSRCATWRRGLLALEDTTVCALDDKSLPPLFFWSISDIDRNRIRRICNFIEFIGGGEKVTGSRAILILLQDILHDPQNRPRCGRSLLSDLKSRTAPVWGRLTGTISLDILCDRISKKEAYKHPYVFGRVLEMLENEYNPNVKRVLKAGFLEQKLLYFPDLRTFDQNRHSRIYWIGNGILKVTREEITLTNVYEQAQQQSYAVIIFLEENMLVYKSKFDEVVKDKDNQFVFPWMCDVIEKISEQTFDEDAILSVLSYITCIGLLQNGWFVHYHNIELLHKRLISNIPNFIERLQGCTVLSFFSLPTVKNVRLRRLHESLNFSLHERKTEYNLEIYQHETIAEPEGNESDETHAVDPIIPNIIPETITVVQRKHLSSGLKSRWSSVEMNILDTVYRLECQTTKVAYAEYLRLCNVHGVADRSFEAFKKKYARLKTTT